MSFCLLSAVLLSARKLKWCPDLAEIQHTCCSALGSNTEDDLVSASCLLCFCLALVIPLPDQAATDLGHVSP